MLRKAAEVDPGLLKRLLRYDALTGRLYWLSRPEEMFADTGSGGRRGAAASWNAKWAGKEAFTALQSAGYKCGRILGRPYLAHRVIWALANGEWPTEQLDHERGNRINNRLTELAPASSRSNARNRARHRNNKSGVCGVYWHRAANRWAAQIGTEAGCKYLGSFESFAAACAARRSAEQAYGFHQNHGRAH